MKTGTVARTIAGTALAACLSVAAPPPAQAAFTFVLTLEGLGSVRATGSGSLDLTGLTFKQRSGSDLSRFEGQLAIIYQSSGSFDIYEGLSGPANFGFDETSTIFASDASGDNVGLFGQGQLIVPAGYVSGTPLNAMLLLNKPLIDIGKPGSYVYSWAGDTFTVRLPNNPGPMPPVPEPATALLLGAGLLGLAALRRRSA